MNNPDDAVAGLWNALEGPPYVGSTGIGFGPIRPWMARSTHSWVNPRSWIVKWA